MRAFAELLSGERMAATSNELRGDAWPDNPTKKEQRTPRGA
jgi:hypothetical protein